MLTKLRLEAIDKHRIRVHLPAFRPRQAALEYGQLPILPRHWWKDRNFANATLEPPMGSGPYRVAAVDQTLTAWGRLLDRALRTQFLGVPGHHEAERKLAIWDRFAWPDRAPGLGYGLEYWWRRD